MAGKTDDAGSEERSPNSRKYYDQEVPKMWKWTLLLKAVWWAIGGYNECY